MEDHIFTQFKIWGVIFLGQITAFNLNAGAQTFMYCCADFDLHPFNFTADGIKAFTFQIFGTYVTDDDV